MFSSVVLALYAAAAVSTVSGLVVPRTSAPAGWATDYLEPYPTYHVRYLALDCQDKHNTPFFDQCCHPLLATETLEKARPAQCVPSPQASSSASAAEPTSTVTTPADDEDEDDCDDDDDAPAPSSAPAPLASSAPALSSTAPAKPETSSAAPEPKTSSATPELKTSSAAPEPKTSSATPEPKTSSAAPEPKTSSAPPEPKTFSAEAPKPSTSQAPPPPPSSKAPEPSSTKAAPPAASSPASKASGGNSGLNLGGFATFFLQNGVAGACGKVHSDDDLIVAIDQDRYGSSGNSSPLCGKQVKITNTQNKKTVTATVADDCPTCKNSNSIDLSKGTFIEIADFATGMVPIEWEFA